MEKNAIRKIIRELKKNIIFPSDYISTLENQVFSKVEMLLEFKNSRNILMYHSLADEFPTRNTIERWARERNIFLPKVVGDDLILLPYSRQKLATGAYGIEEPTTVTPVSPSQIDLIIVPAMAFDSWGNRLGRGKGYYDRLLSQSAATRIGIGYDFQLLDCIPAEPHDIKMHYIFTPNCSITICNQI